LHRVVDIALATSAAPAYFPRHVFNNGQYVDGGRRYANAPGLLGLHEALTFFGRDLEQVRLLSVGTMSSRFTVDPRQNCQGGVRDWGGWARYAGVAIRSFPNSGHFCPRNLHPFGPLRHSADDASSLLRTNHLLDCSRTRSRRSRVDEASCVRHQAAPNSSTPSRDDGLGNMGEDSWHS
jgi:hypothetical protein